MTTPSDTATARLTLPSGDAVLVDFVDLDLVSQHNWCLDKTGYAIGRVRSRRQEPMHRFLLGFPKQRVWHRNGDKLDNRRANLVVGSSVIHHQQDHAGWRGVSKQAHRYEASVTCKGKRHHLGTFDTPLEAARAYDAAARHFYSEAAVTNFEGLVTHFGSREAAYTALYDATQVAVRAQGTTGVFQTAVNVAGQSVTVRGNVIDGVLRLSTAFVP